MVGDSIFAAAAGAPASTTTNTGFATLQTNKKKPIPAPSSTGSGVPPWMGSGNDIWSTLSDEYGKVDSSFDTTAAHAAFEANAGNLLTSSEQSANAAGADYAARARQAGGSAEGAGLVKAQALVTGRQGVADARMKELQWEIEQKEKARTLAAGIAGQLGGLRSDFLKNLTNWHLGVLDANTRKSIAKQQTDLGYAQIGEQSKEFGWLHPVQQRVLNPNYDPYYEAAHNPTGSPWGGMNPTGTPFTNQTTYWPGTGH